MTRDKLRTQEFDHTGRQWYYKTEVDKLLNDFESRTCENCKWYYEPRKNCNYGYCKKLLNDEEFRVDDKSFGCSKFGRKEV